MSLQIREMITPGHENPFTVGRSKGDASLEDLPAVHRALLGDDPPVTAVLATVRASGPPQLSPVWFSLDGERLQLNSARGRVIQRQPINRP